MRKKAKRYNIDSTFLKSGLGRERKLLKASGLPQSKRWDKSPPGFGLLLSRTGSVSFIVRGKNVDDRQQQLTLGALGDMSVAEARAQARIKLDALADGETLKATEGSITLQAAQEQGQTIRGSDEDHVSILSSETVTDRVYQLLFQATR